MCTSLRDINQTGNNLLNAVFFQMPFIKAEANQRMCTLSLGSSQHNCAKISSPFEVNDFRKDSDPGQRFSLYLSPQRLGWVSALCLFCLLLTWLLSGCAEDDSIGRILGFVGDYHNLAEHHDGKYHMELSDERVTATITTVRSPVRHWAREVAAPLFILPPEFRPPFPITRTVDGQLVDINGSPGPDLPATHRFRVRISEDGSVHYVDDEHMEGLEYLAYTLHTVWGSTPAAADLAVLEILDSAWSGEGELSGSVQEKVLGATFDPKGRVTALAWDNRGLSGQIPSELGQLSQLQELWLNANQLTGPIPPELGQLSQIQRLVLSTNHLTGPIPPELGQLSELQNLWLGSNLLTGPIPPELGQLPNLQILSLSRNQLTGPIPPELGQLSELRGLWLFDNRLSGFIPPEIGQLNQIQVLLLSNNRLTREIPAELGQLSNLREFRLDANRLTGSIPRELGHLSNLQILSFTNNKLTGPIPPELSHLENLLELYLSENRLQEPIPPELGGLSQLQMLFLNNNRLTGPIPADLSQLGQLQWLVLNSNHLTGPIPAEFGQLKQLFAMYIHENHLMGPIPPELGQLTNLKQVEFRDNPLTGCLPSAWQGRVAIIRSWSGDNPPPAYTTPYCWE